MLRGHQINCEQNRHLALRDTNKCTCISLDEMEKKYNIALGLLRMALEPHLGKLGGIAEHDWRIKADELLNR